MSAPTKHKNAIITMLLAGVAPRDIMAATGCSHGNINDLRIWLNLPPHSKGGRPRKSA